MIRAIPWLGVAALLACACISKTPVVELETLPADPIAFVFLEPERARDLADRMKHKEGGAAAPQNEGVARLAALARVLAARTDDIASSLLGRPSLLDPRTGEVTPFEALPKGSRPLEWSSDRTRLLFAGPRFDIFQLSEVNVATGDVRTVTQGQEDHPSGSLAPDGTLAFSQLVGATGAKAGEARIWLRSPGGQPRAITAGPADSSPVFSPDGSVLVYQTRGADGALAVAALTPPDGAPRILARGRDPSFSPDGQWIVYSQKLAVGFRLWRMRPDGSGRITLGEAPGEIGEEIHPTVSADGRYVAYVAERESRRTLRVRRFDGGGDRPLLETGDGMLPVW